MSNFSDPHLLRCTFLFPGAPSNNDKGSSMLFLTTLDLHKTGLIGSPFHLIQSSGLLSYLDFSNNLLTGTLPDGLGCELGRGMESLNGPHTHLRTLAAQTFPWTLFPWS